MKTPVADQELDEPPEVTWPLPPDWTGVFAGACRLLLDEFAELELLDELELFGELALLAEFELLAELEEPALEFAAPAGDFPVLAGTRESS
jgi:hypothetical protein